MAGKSDYLELELLKWAIGDTNDLGTANTPYIGLYTSVPTDAGGGTEVTGGSYARVNGTAGFGAAPAAGAVANSVAITFPQATAAWGTITAFGIFDAATAGNLLYWGTIGSVVVGDNQTAQFGIGALSLTED